MNKEELKIRTKEFAIRIINFIGGLPNNKIGNVLGTQLLKSGTSIGANYCEVIRGESYNDFIHKIGIIQKEAEETQYWLELLEATNLGEAKERQWLYKECCELLAIFTATIKTAKQRRNSKSAIRN
ncbi:MAG: four helix bundle protein [Planctomycetota bacterium]